MHPETFKICPEVVKMRPEKEINKYIGNQLRLRRLLLGLSQEKLAENLGITFQQVQKYEKGINKVSAERLFAISRILNSNISYFFDGLIATCTENQENSLAEDDSSYEEDLFSKKETTDLLRVYYLIESSHVRKHVLNLLRAIHGSLVAIRPSGKSPN